MLTIATKPPQHPCGALYYKSKPNNPVMNLSQVNTPAELLEQNSTPAEATPPSVSRLDALVEELDINETYELSLKLLQQLGSYHQYVIKHLQEQTPVELERLVVWSADEQKLHTCYDLLDQVANND